MHSEDDSDEPEEPPEGEDRDEDDDDDKNNSDSDEDDGMVADDSDEEGFVEFSSSGRYGRYSEILGKGAMKTVYRAYDTEDCKEVAWNKSKPPIECSEEQASAVQREIEILKRLHHQGIIKLYSAWVDDTTGDANFITELCSTTLLDYRLKHKHISRKAVKNWGRQILKGLVHLHMQDPPIIHRDLKCENIFVKCRSNGVLKIGDFGSATYLDETHHMHTLVGTPEFMAPEMYQEDYNELVDVYSFGMCILELLTRECPYSECKSLGQIYKKVINGEKPKALQKVTDIQALKLINRCLLPAAQRPSASELLADPFLQQHGGHNGARQSMKPSASMPNLGVVEDNIEVKKFMGAQNVITKSPRLSAAARRKVDHMDMADHPPLLGKSPGSVRRKGICIKSPSFRRSYRVMGRVEDQYTLHLKIRIQESSRSCDIAFPFDLRSDSPKSVAEEMIRTLDYSNTDLSTIADLIREEIVELVPEMKQRYVIHSGVMNHPELLHGNEPCGFESFKGRKPEGNRDDEDSNAASSELLVVENRLNTSCTDDLSTYTDNSASGKTDGRATYVSSAINKIVSLDGAYSLSSMTCNECDTSSDNASVSASTISLEEGSAAGAADDSCRERTKNESASFRSTQPDAPSSLPPWKGASKFKQPPPAGLGILLRPSNGNVLRRGMPSCLNAHSDLSSCLNAHSDLSCI